MSIESIKVRDLNTVSTLHDDDLLLVARNAGSTENIKASDLLLYISSNSSQGSFSVVKWEKAMTGQYSGTLISTYLNTPGLSGISIDSTKTYYYLGMHVESNGGSTAQFFQYNGVEIPVLAGSKYLSDAPRIANAGGGSGLNYAAHAFISGSNLYINNNLAGVNNNKFYFSFIGI